jgi:cellobiose phosphorylase
MLLETPLRTVQSWLVRSRDGDSRKDGPEILPLRAELLNLDRLREYGRELAGRHEVLKGRGRNELLAQLAHNETALREAYESATTALAEGRRVTLATEWLVDNFYLIKQQINIARTHLPRTYSGQLPRLQNGQPRVYEIALELISHTDGRVDAENLSAFIAAYQSVAPLNLGELWAVPIMLRLALIENIHRVADDIVRRRRQRKLAAHWAERMIAGAESNPKRLPKLLADMAEFDPPFTGPFVQEFFSKLQGQSPAVSFVLTWVEHRLNDEGVTMEQLLRADSHRVAADQVSIGNSITSLRFLGAMDWREFVESMSATEQTLRRDPASVYPKMDFATRDRYRHVVEAIGQRSRLTEEQIAGLAIGLAEHGDARASHVGFYLVAQGRPLLERAAQVRRSFQDALARLCRCFPMFCYLTPILLLTVATTELVIAHTTEIWIVILGLLAASQMAVAVVNLLVSAFVRPRLLPRMDFSRGIPAEHRTIVVIPSLLSSRQTITELLDDLEVRYLGNRDPNLLFGLLTDFPDATEQTQPEDAGLLQMAHHGIESLNERYGQDGSTVFYLFNRPRVWNPHERIWMGYERKRGKLEQFNALLRGGSREAFAEIVGDVSVLQTIQYVVTLDSDTQLPRDAAHKLVGTIAHPLNRPQFDPQSGRVVDGYTILQPRTSISLTAAGRSRFARLCGGDTGIDPYTREVSDVYQDIFNEGSYVGKGIYHVDAFLQALRGRFPENLILSHDLLESCYARSGLVADVELVEDHPASYAVEVSRRHRWIRGDWQIAAWLLPRVPGPNGRCKNPIHALGWWKIFDNLRRSLATPAMLLLLLCGWTLAPAAPGFWTGFVAALVFAPLIVGSVLELLRKPRDRSWRTHLETSATSSARQLAHTALSLSMLPYRALVNLDAILHSAGRMLFTRRGLLIWHTPENARRNERKTLAEFYREMWVAPAVGMTGFILLALHNPRELPVCGPLLFLWLLSPAIGWWISQPLSQPAPTLSAPDREFLRTLARKTWRYFEAFVGPNENWLPPDNFQEVPVPIIASRTSPTNIGLALLANLVASDFGYIGVGELLERTEKTLATMEKLEHYRGHLYNWYDTRTLKPLPPQYVSSVDSGNLAGAVFTLRAGLYELKSQPIFSSRILTGLADTLRTSGQEPPETLRSTPRSPAEALALLEQLEASRWPADAQRQRQQAEDDLLWLVPEVQQFDKMPTLEELAKLPGLGSRAAERIKLIDTLAERCSEQAEMDFSILFDPSRDLLAIGYNVTDHRLDPSYYDLLASECRLASFILIARGQLPQDHWFALGRQLTSVDSTMALLSWSGSMFEYLMPLVIMPNYNNTLLDLTYRAAVTAQIEYAQRCDVPWGISESCYNATDANQVYQYRAFGVPGLGYKRGLADDLVVAPYASALALMIMPEEACKNLQSLAQNGYQGAYGFYEAIDFTPARLPRGKTSVTIRNFMAHHQAMTLLSLAHMLLNRPMQRRFLSDPYFKATELLLQERIPKAAATLQPHEPELSAVRKPVAEQQTVMRVFKTPHTPIPEVHLLSNGRYSLMATNAGGGYSRWKGLAVTRWREDGTRDCWGTFCYLRDVASRRFWSTAFQPTLRPSQNYEAIFIQGRAEYRRRDEEIDSHTEISVSPEDDVEVRRVTLRNLSDNTRTMELTSYAEVVLAPLNADLAHPVFSNLFVQTEILRDRRAILCTRRPRSPDENPPWMFHLLTPQGAPAGDVSFETDRAKFIGRTRTAANPAAFDQVGPLSDTDGSVLDPIVAIRQAVLIDPKTSANFHIVTGVAESREAAVALIEKYRDASFAARAFEMAWSHSQVMLRNLQISEADTQLYSKLAASVLFTNPLHRAPSSVIARNRRGQSGLWGSGISGDLPIVLMRISDANRIDLVKQILHAHAYWRLQGLDSDLVILNEDFSGYRQALQDRIMGLITGGTEAQLVDKPGGIFVRRTEQMSEEDRVLLHTVARVVLTDSAETLTEQVERRAPAERRVPRFTPTRPAVIENAHLPAQRELLLFNGLGGFTSDGREYVITLAPGQTCPAPWSNVIASPYVGTVVSEGGGAYTWVDNAHEFRLTPWHNDPLCDTSGEALYLRDEETGKFWSPTPLPARGTGHYVCRHGFGYSVFESVESGIASEFTTYVSMDAPVKFAVVKLRNQSGRNRRLSVTGYWELVLGEWRHTNLLHMVTEIDPSTGALLARNAFNRDFADKVAFVHVSEPGRTVTANRIEFLGRNGTPGNPAAMRQSQLSGKTGAGLDPCAALLVQIDLPAGQEREIVFVIGAGSNTEDAQRLVRRFCGIGGARQALGQVWEFWKRSLGVVYAETPDPALNVLVNGWLEYQALSARYWGRSGYYQSGGAYGFRDQLQDTAALIHAAPWTAREHLLRCGSRQFREGDVQHWWHPPSGRGVRTHFSDDYLWLPYATCRYLVTTDDTGVLDERLPFLEGRPVNAGEESYYDLPQRSEETGTLYEHCVRAIKYGLKFGEHGLPLMGCGDWNDGMNLVGQHGKGESVWLAFFLYHVLQQFSDLARRRNDESFAVICAKEAEDLRQRIEATTWDGRWYRRAYFDDGTPLGSATNDECQIDSISQSWAVLSGAGDRQRARAGMEALAQRLVRRKEGLIRLLDPPFDKSPLQPGYIKGYVPGVRENGGQYTHGAIWAVMAFAELGEVERAWELFAMLNPVRHETNVYRVEPYVVAADVYAVLPHTGRGGWTWYTGSAAWMYRLIVESLLGLRLESGKLRLRPSLPAAWESFKIHYRFRETFYHLTVKKGGLRKMRITLDGVEQPQDAISLVDDRQEHQIEVTL